MDHSFGGDFSFFSSISVFCMDDAVGGVRAEAEAGALEEARLLCLDSTPLGLAGTHWNEPVGDGRPVIDSRGAELALLCVGSGNVIGAAGSS
jgi:hypothetical protein